MKAGYKTSEFWITLVGLVGGMVLSVVSSDSIAAQVAGGLLAAVCGSSYTMGRSWNKGKIGAAEGHAKVVAETLLKKSSSD